MVDLPEAADTLTVLAEQLRRYLVSEGLVVEKSGAELRAHLNEVMSKFDKLVARLKKDPKVKDPDALAAWIGWRAARARRGRKGLR
jgi:hypothetical protein